MTTEFIANLPGFQTFVTFLFYEKLFLFLPPSSTLNSLLHSQFPSLVLITLVLSSWVTFSLLCKTHTMKSVITTSNQALMPGSFILSRKLG